MGQVSVTTALVEDTSGNACGIFRSWKNSKAVAYHMHEGEHLFSIIDSATRMVYSAKVPDVYNIMDFRIVGDTAYCGGSRLNTGMLAYFNINDIITNPTIDFNTAIISGITIITRLTAFRNRRMNGVGIAAIGEEVRVVGLYHMAKSHMIWCDNYGSTTFSGEEREGDIYWDMTTPSETLSDVVESGNYVAFVGSYTNSNDLCIRLGSKDGIFSTTMINTVHKFYYSAKNLESLPVAEPLGRDTIAVAVACEDIPGMHSAQIYLFDLQGMQMYNVQRVKFSNDDKGAVNELVYMPRSKTLLMAFETGGVHRVVYSKPSVLGTYSATAIAPSTGDILCSMDYHNGSYYILSTAKHWMLQHMNLIPANTCLTFDDYVFQVWPVSMDVPLYHFRTTNPFSFNLQQLYPTTFYNEVYCVYF